MDITKLGVHVIEPILARRAFRVPVRQQEVERSPDRFSRAKQETISRGLCQY